MNYGEEGFERKKSDFSPVKGSMSKNLNQDELKEDNENENEN